MKKILYPVLLTLISFQLLFSQDPVTFKTKVEKISDLEYQLIVTTDIEKNWRLYSQFLEEGGAIPTEFSFYDSNNHFKLQGNVQESESITKYDPIFGLNQSYFENSNIFKQKIIITKKNLSSVLAKISYQACDDAVCIFRDSELEFNLDGTINDIENDDLTTLVSSENNPLLLNLKNKELLNSSLNSDLLVSNNYFNLLLLGFIGGILALLTPCVFPMIPLTVSFFNNKSNETNSLLNPLFYGLCIIMIFIGLSIPFHFMDSIDPEILNSISTNSFLNVIFFLVFIFFAFSFFGFYDISLPASWINSMDSKSNSLSGFLGIFFMAFTLVLVSFSCTGPILGSLLVGSITSQGGAIQLTLGMLGFGIALALPFTLFASFPKMLTTIPKSGRWMNTFKIILGFLELGFAFKFLSNADLVEHWGFLKREIFIGIWVLISIFIFLYLVGLFKFPHENEVLKRTKFNTLLSIGFLIFAVYLFPAILPGGSNKARILSGFTPPSFYSVYETKNDCPLGFNCFKDFDKGLKHANEVNKPILLDFTGWACVNCRRVEENVWTELEIYNLINDNFVLISLYVDDRKELDVTDQFELKYASGRIKKIKTIGDKSATFQAINFKNASQPYYVLLDTDLTILNSPIQYTNSKVYKAWLKEGLDNLK